MDEMIDRRAAGIHAHIIAETGLEGLLAVRQRIIQEHGRHPFRVEILTMIPLIACKVKSDQALYLKQRNQTDRGLRPVYTCRKLYL